MTLSPSSASTEGSILVSADLVSAEDPNGIVVPLYAEEALVKRRKVERAVRVHVRTTGRDQLIDEPLEHEKVEIERVAIGRPVDLAPPVREEGDTTIISVVEEEVVVQRRLILKEEIRLRRVRTTDRHRETVNLREQQVVIERSESGAPGGPAPELAPIPKPQSLKE